jgi:hypothetical protein
VNPKAATKNLFILQVVRHTALSVKTVLAGSHRQLQENITFHFPAHGSASATTCLTPDRHGRTCRPGKPAKYHLRAWMGDAASPSRGQTVTFNVGLRAKDPIRVRTFQSRVYECYGPAVSSIASSPTGEQQPLNRVVHTAPLHNRCLGADNGRSNTLDQTTEAIEGDCL